MGADEVWVNKPEVTCRAKFRDVHGHAVEQRRELAVSMCVWGGGGGET